MIDLDEKFGFTRWRVAVLVGNLLGNAVALYAAVRFIRRGTHGWMLVAGLAITVLCVGLLARPDTRDARPSRTAGADGAAADRASGGGERAGR